MMALQPDVANADDEVMPYIYLNNAMLLAKYFDKRDNMKKQPGAYFHIGYPPMYFFYNMLEIAFPGSLDSIQYMARHRLRRVLMKICGSWNRNCWKMCAAIRSGIKKMLISMC